MAVHPTGHLGLFRVVGLGAVNQIADEQSDARERRSRSELSWKISRRRPVIGDVIRAENYSRRPRAHSNPSLMTELSQEQRYEGVAVDIPFVPPGPEFGDLFLICGYDNPNFPPTGKYPFGSHAELGFSQVDDYFGIESDSDDGDDVIVWLYPVVSGECVDHHPGPFDAIRLQFNVLRNSPQNSERFLKCVTSLATLSAATAPNIDAIRSEIDMITDHWIAEGITPGSSEALELDF